MTSTTSLPEDSSLHERAVFATLQLVEELQSRTPDLETISQVIGEPLERVREIFVDEQGLLTSVVEQAMMILMDDCTRAIVKIDPNDPMGQCQALIETYLIWVTTHRSQFRLMSDQRLIDVASDKHLRRYQESINELVSKMMFRAQEQGQLHPKENIPALILTSRCFVYGTARMIVDGRLGDFSTYTDPMEAAQNIARDYIRRIARGSRPR